MDCCRVRGILYGPIGIPLGRQSVDKMLYYPMSDGKSSKTHKSHSPTQKHPHPSYPMAIRIASKHDTFSNHHMTKSTTTFHP